MSATAATVTKREQTCSICRQPGHNKTTCPEKAAVVDATAEKPVAKPAAAAPATPAKKPVKKPVAKPAAAAPAKKPPVAPQPAVAAKPAPADAAPKKVITCSACKQQGHTCRSKSCPMANKA